MKTQPNDGGPAFPMPAHTSTIGEQARPIYGMSLRDYFAAAALQGEFSNPTSGVFEADSITFSEVAWDCYKMADAMLAARERKECA